MTAPDVRGRLRRAPRARRQAGGRRPAPHRRPRARPTSTSRSARAPTPRSCSRMAAVIVQRGAGAADALRGRASRGWDEVERRLARARASTACARFTGVPARDASSASPSSSRRRRRAVAYSRIGVCNGAFGTLASYATDLLNLVAGRLGEVGGAMFPTPAIDAARLLRMTGGDGHGALAHAACAACPRRSASCPRRRSPRRSRRRARARSARSLTFAGNPVLSTPNGRAPRRGARAASTSWSRSTST